MSTCPWSNFEPSTMQFCERQLCGWITQPANTWSNLAFIMIGLVLVHLSRRDQTGTLVIVGISAVVLGIGSGLFHLSSVFIFEVLDFMAMFLISALMVCLNLQRLVSLRPVAIYSLYVFLVLISVAIMFVWKIAGVPVFTLQLAVALTLEVLLHIRGDKIKYKYFLFMIGSFVLAFTAWTIDISGFHCDPDNHLVTGHAIWHCFNALAIYFLYRFHEQFITEQGTLVTGKYVLP